MTIRFEETHEFKKHFKRLSKRYRTLPEDFVRLRTVLEISPVPDGKHTNVVTIEGDNRIIKIRLACRALRQSSLRLIYAYDEKQHSVTFIELYFKGDKETEDTERIRQFLNAKRSV